MVELRRDVWDNFLAKEEGRTGNRRSCECWLKGEASWVARLP